MALVLSISLYIISLQFCSKLKQSSFGMGFIPVTIRYKKTEGFFLNFLFQFQDHLTAMTLGDLQFNHSQFKRKHQI